MRNLFSALAASALLALPAASPAAIVINEIMYDPISTDNQATTEYVELYNTDATTVSLAGYRINAGSFTPFTFPAGAEIAGNGFVLLQSFELDTLLSLYKGGIDPAIVYRLDQGATIGSKLANASGTVTLFDAGNTEIDRVTYSKTSPWPTTPNPSENLGHSLELVDPLSDNASGANWLVSISPVGTPGHANTRATTTNYSNFSRTPENPTSSDQIQFSITATSALAIESVDLYLENLTGSAGFTPIPMTTSGAGNYSVTVGPYADNTLLRYYIKIVDANNTEVIYPPLAPLAPGVVQVKNAQYTADDFVINEIMINPKGADNGTGSEYVELFNKTAQPIDLSYYILGRTLTDSYWRVLPEGTVLPANGYLILAGRADLFATEWGATLDPSVPVVNLAWRRTQSVFVQSGTEAFLANPNQINWDEMLESSTITPFQHVKFTLGANGWPTEAASADKSLELTSPNLDPTVGANWTVSSAIPGGTPGASNSTSSITDWSVY